MLIGKQVDRLVAKVMRLAEVYQPFLITQTLAPQVTLTENGITRPVQKGDHWGGEFQMGRFQFVAEGLEPGKKYRLFANTGAVEHQIAVNGRSVGMLDHIDHASEPMFRIHRYLWLEGLKNGDEVTLDAYYSHTFPNTMPYDGTFTFGMDGHYPHRTYEAIGLVVYDETVYEFTEKLELLNAWYREQTPGSFTAAAAEKVYEQLFELLPIKQIRPAEDALRQAIAVIDGFLSGPEPKPYVGIIGHSHLDTAWLWPVAETRRKLRRTVSNAVTLLERYPGYKFFLSTVLYLQWLEEDDPELFQKVGQLIRQGRIEPNGATWVECDGNLTGAEALCRQFLRGKRYLREKFGYESDTFWLPDTFGYSAAMPQILRQCGVKYFLTTKLSWNDTNTFPYETFLWLGIDGSSVPVHFNSIQTWIDEESVGKRLAAIRDKRESDCVLMAYGFGDGGGGPSEQMVTRALYTEEHCKSAVVEHTSVSDFMKKATDRPLAPYFGELYLELHRGTYTSGHALKQNNRRLEEAMHDAELISVFAGENTKQKTDELYDVLLLNQFHDILPGTCIAEATDIAIAEQQQALAEARILIAGGEGEKRYFNTLPFARNEYLPADSAVPGAHSYVGLDGENKTVARFGFDAYGYGVAAPAEHTLTFDGQTVENACYTAKVKDGVITSLVCNGRELAGKGLGLIQFGEDVPYIYDNWDIDADYTKKLQNARFVSMETVLQSRDLLILRSVYELGHASRLTVDMKFRADTALIEFENRLDWADTQTLAQARFDTTLFAQHYRCETQFGFVERNCYPSDVTDHSKFEVCAHKWTDLSEHKIGMSLLSDSKYGVSCHGKTLGLTLHKSGTHPDARGDRGTHFFRYGLLPHVGGCGMETVRAGYAFNQMPVLTARQELQAPFALEGGWTVIPETVKYGEDGGIVLRLYESLGASEAVTLRTKEERSFRLCNILEDVQQNLPAGKEITLEFVPFEIKTIRID
ncbi:MAG: alpha-mannosidase [Ruminococcaceae bacterium]|nr:alpha-mannosidase [Oscillospiraceae bacterium]